MTKKIQTLAFAGPLLAGMLLTGCDCLDCVPGTLFNVIPGSLWFSHDAGQEETGKVLSSCDWRLADDLPAWLDVEPKAGNGPSTNITITTMEPNTGADARTHTLVFTSSCGGRRTIEVTQLHDARTVDYDLPVLYGTVFPFVHTGDAGFDALFVTTVRLYAVPPATIFDKIGYIRTQTPVQEVHVTYYDQSTYIPETPKYPGTMGTAGNPGLPISWRDKSGVNPDTADNAPVTGVGDMPDAPVGKYLLNIAPGTYVMEISRAGFLFRYGVITVDDRPQQYLGHRELLAGDVNGDSVINERDLSALPAYMGNYGTPVYNARYDLNGSKSVDNDDADIIRFNLYAFMSIYTECADWLAN